LFQKRTAARKNPRKFGWVAWLQKRSPFQIATPGTLAFGPFGTALDVAIANERCTGIALKSEQKLADNKKQLT